jgi:hypothetical protein
MSKYSFLVQTKTEGYFELLPEIRLKKYGSWLVAESIEQEEISKLQSQATIRAVQLAKRIAASREIPLMRLSRFCKAVVPSLKPNCFLSSLKRL